jgi:hypothetical protein
MPLSSLSSPLTLCCGLLDGEAGAAEAVGGAQQGDRRLHSRILVRGDAGEGQSRGPLGTLQVVKNVCKYLILPFLRSIELSILSSLEPFRLVNVLFRRRRETLNLSENHCYRSRSVFACSTLRFSAL